MCNKEIKVNQGVWIICNDNTRIMRCIVTAFKEDRQLYYLEDLAYDLKFARKNEELFLSMKDACEEVLKRINDNEKA